MATLSRLHLHADCTCCALSGSPLLCASGCVNSCMHTWADTHDAEDVPLRCGPTGCCGGSHVLGAERDVTGPCPTTSQDQTPHTCCAHPATVPRGVDACLLGCVSWMGGVHACCRPHVRGDAMHEGGSRLAHGAPWPVDVRRHATLVFRRRAPTPACGPACGLCPARAMHALPTRGVAVCGRDV